MIEGLGTGWERLLMLIELSSGELLFILRANFLAPIFLPSFHPCRRGDEVPDVIYFESLVSWSRDNAVTTFDYRLVTVA